MTGGESREYAIEYLVRCLKSDDYVERTESLEDLLYLGMIDRIDTAIIVKLLGSAQDVESEVAQKVLLRKGVDVVADVVNMNEEVQPAAIDKLAMVLQQMGQPARRQLSGIIAGRESSSAVKAKAMAIMKRVWPDRHEEDGEDK
jgi:hypothetical protein